MTVSKPYQSPLEQYYEFIRDARRARKTWREISAALKKKNVAISDKGLIMWFKRRQKRTSLPLGFAAEETTISNSDKVAKLLKAPISSTPSSIKPWDFGVAENSPLTKK